MITVTTRDHAADNADHEGTTTTGPQTHVVQAGDTLFSMARRYGVTVEAIQQANHLTGDAIAVGQQLIVPAAP